jgi:nucleotide-binding universal stress UspA family protein
MASGSSDSASSGSATRSGSWSSASTPRTVKQEPATTPRRNSGALVIREGGARTASLPRRCKTKKDAGAKAASDLAETEARRAEEAATNEAIQRSLRDVVPAENTMPLDAALEWSRREWEREEREQQRRLLDLAAAQRRAAAATLPRRGTPPVVKLEESSDDELYRPTPPRFGDAGQGSSRQAPPPQDDDSSDDGDYTMMYRRFGM